MKSGYKFIRVMAFLLFAAGPFGAAAESQFLSAIEDLPLMTGLNEVDGGVMVFDSPAGRIVEALTMGAVSKDAVLRYYRQTLPQLGWLERPPGQFSREGEMLKLEFPQTQAISGSGSPLISVRFMLSPVN
ncbi:MAG: hypothetical protein HQ513_05140 [Rhodospirillales bacterium]|nr:hypothetical protein [Rhodospirillales bacterium]